MVKFLKQIFLLFTGSPTLPTNGTVLLNGANESFFPSLPSPPNSIASTNAPTGMPPGAPPQQTGLIPPPSSVYLPPFPFTTHPELLHKSPFLPYGSLRPPHSMTSAQHPEQQQINIGRLSPASSRNSVSPPSNSQSTPNHRINSSIELNSTNDHSSHHSSSEDSDDEHIDVVKSAFVPCLKVTKGSMVTTSTPDSTVKEQSPSREFSHKIKCELKAPSSKKQHLHEKAQQNVPNSPETKLKSSPAITQQCKKVWRPY